VKYPNETFQTAKNDRNGGNRNILLTELSSILSKSSSKPSSAPSEEHIYDERIRSEFLHPLYISRPNTEHKCWKDAAIARSSSYQVFSGKMTVASSHYGKRKNGSKEQ